MSSWPRPLARAYAACERLAQSHYENFPVASRLLPARMRPHVAAVYVFARTADDIADEGDVAPEARRARLNALREQLHRAVAADAAGEPLELEPPDAPEDLEAPEAMLRALAHSMRTLDLPVSLFEDLLSAFGQDTTTTRYASWAEVFDYCRRSANPVGRLVLRIAGIRDEHLDRSSDALCTALQLANFWQDFGRDWKAGRLYVPREVQDACGARESDLSGATLSPAWVRALASCADVTDAQFGKGRLVCDGVSGRLRIELRLTWLGGHLILQRARAQGAQLLSTRPVIRTSDLPRLVWRAIRWEGAAG